MFNKKKKEKNIMNDNKFYLTETDNNAVLLNDSNYINNKGANLYRPDTYKEAVEYYRLAAAMGNVHSIHYAYDSL